MIRKTVKMFFLKDNPSELKLGMICYSKSSDSFFKDYYRLTEYSDLNSEDHQPVLPYIVDVLDHFESKSDSLFLFTFKNESEPVVANFDDLLGHELDDAQLIVAEPHQIGLIKNEFYTGEGNNEPKYYDLFNIKQKLILKKILVDNGMCTIAAIDEFTNPEEYQNIAWGEGIGRPKLIDGKVLIFDF